MRYKLIIDNNLIEVEETELSQVSIALTKQFESLNNPTKYYGEWSKSVNIPFTSRNNRIFQNIFRVDGLVTNFNIDPRKKIGFILLYNEEIVTRGYCKVTNVYNDITNKYSQVNLFSNFGMLLNEMKQLTFFSNTDTDPKYIIANPLSEGLTINRHLVKQSFEKEKCTININNKTDLDYIGFVPSYQGKYNNFESSKYDIISDIIENPYGECDEHYMREFRSYYQTPYIWVNALFQLVKQKIESITDYQFILDKSFFNKNNPYWSNTIYTCPSLFNENSDNIDSSTKEKYGVYNQQYKSQTTVLKDCSNHHTKILPFQRSSGNYIYNSQTKRFTPKGDSTHFKENVVWWLFVSAPFETNSNNYCKLREDNALYLKFSAVNANTMQPITGAEKIFCFYDGDNTRTNFDVGIELDVTNRDYPRAVTTAELGVTDKDKGFLWSGELQIEFDINTSEPFYIVCDQYTANNDKPFETAYTSYTPHWDWMWVDLWDSKGFTWYISCVRAEVENQLNIRSNSELTLQRIWSKDISIYDVIMNYCKMFHLMFDLDEDNKTFTITTRNRYFEPYTIEDWSTKIDRNKNYILQPIWFNKKYLTFKYVDGKGQRYEYYQSKYKKSYGEIKVDTGYEFSNEEENLIENLNSSMVCSKKQSSYVINTNNPEHANFKGYGYKVLPAEVYIENDNNGSNANNFGSFYFHNGTIQVDSSLSAKDTNNKPYIIISDDSTRQIKKGVFCWGGSELVKSNVIPLISLYSADGKYSILFNEPKELYFNQNVIELNNPKYLYQSYWEKYFNERYNVQNKMLTCYLYLTPTDYKNFKFNKFIILDNILYLVNKISDYDISTKTSTKVELFQIYDINAYTKSNLVFPYLYTLEDNLFVTEQKNTTYVYSTSDWSIQRKPYWLKVEQDNNYLNYWSNTITNKDRSGVIILKNSDGIMYMLTVEQKATETYIITTLNNHVFPADGGSVRLGISSYPNNNIIVNDVPDWFSVDIHNAFGKYAITIVCNNNTTVLGRTATITLSNGFASTPITISQQGNRILTVTNLNDSAFDITKPIVLSETEDNNINITIQKEINPETITVTKIPLITKPIQKINKVPLTIPITKAKATETDTCTGGVIRINQTDNTTVMIDFNIGENIKKYNVYLQNNVLVDGVEYYNYFEQLPEGTIITVEAVETDSLIFTQWSDGNTDNPRQLIINHDINIYPILTDNKIEYLTFDNKETIQFDDKQFIDID